MVRLRLLASTCIAGSALVAYPAAAQQQGSPGAASPQAAVGAPALTNEAVGAPTPGSPTAGEGTASDGTAASGLQDIVVTAQRRAENLQRAAIPVSAISGDTLAAAGITRPTELTSVVPALQVATAAGPYNLFYLRGVGNFNANAFSDSAVAFNFDGVYVGRPSSSTGFFYDLERVEVVKGPQGTLYGRNATGGAINVITKKPELRKFGANFLAEYGNYDVFRLDGAINLPVGDNAAFRLAGLRVRHDGYMNDGTDDQDDWGGRASFRVDPTDDLRINVVADYFKQDGRGAGSTPLLAPGGVPTAATFDVDDRIGLLSAQGQGLYTSLRAGPFGRNFYPITLVPFQNNRFWGISGTLDWQTEVGTLTVVPAYREAKLDYRSFAPGFLVRQIENSDQTSVEARFATTEDFPVRAILGGFYFKENTDDPYVTYNHQVNAQWQSNVQLSTESTAVFGRLTYAVTPEIRLNVGARQTWEDKSFNGRSQSYTRVCTIGNCPTAPQLPYEGDAPPFVGGPVAPGLIQIPALLTADNQADFKKFTWRAGADWDISPRNLLYASFETGFKAGGFFFSTDNPATPDAEGVYRPETIKAFTVGSKNRFFDNRLQLNLELFHWRYKDQQLSHLIRDFSNTTIFATENIGRATFKGFEVETKLAATETTTLNLDVQYLDAKYNSFVYTQANQSGATAIGTFNGTACPNQSVTALVFVVDCSGRRPTNAPKWTVNVGGQQRIPVSFGEFVADGRAHYQTRTLTGQEFLPVEYQDGYWLVDAALTFYAPERRFFVGGFINNMFDETVVGQAFPPPFASPSFFAATLRPPRTYGIRAGVKF